MTDYDPVELNNLKNFANNHSFLFTDQARLMVRIVKRPVITVHKDCNYIVWSTYPADHIISPVSEEPFVIYHVGNLHFEPLVKKSDHSLGEIGLNYSEVEFEDENNSANNRSIVFTKLPGGLQKKLFSSSQNSRLEAANFLNQNKVRILFNENSEEVEKNFKAWEKYITGWQLINNVKITITDATNIRVERGEIIFDYKSFISIYPH
ncbi:MAG: hypothetical protein MRERC_2c138 [Mycoplasmataceae bacterium RC_NB112A]|nr:MAG: hypothetical protein MRERC_2c138 [Mycoplasmataceae bacterium RC_NB112A]